MTRSAGYSEDALVEQPAIALFAELGWTTENLYAETFAPGGGSHGRETRSEPYLLPRLRAALARLSPHLPPDSIDRAVADLTRHRTTLSLAAANQELYRLLKDGVKVTFTKPNGTRATETARVINWTTPTNNNFFLASQFWLSGDLYTRRADLVGFVNGLPLLFVELKASHRNLEDAFKKNLRDYKSAIPHLFWSNALILLSNGSQTRVGSVTSSWDHFSNWKKSPPETSPVKSPSRPPSAAPAPPIAS